MRKSKKLSQRIHAKRRISERYGIDVNRQTLREMISLLNHSTFVYRQSSRTTFHLIHYEDKPMLVVYDKTRHTLATALPEDANIITKVSEIAEKIETIKATYKKKQLEKEKE